MRLLLFALIGVAVAYRVATLSDLHYDSEFNPWGSPATYCRMRTAGHPRPYRFSTHGCDSSHSLIVDSVDAFFATTEPDLVVLGGDLPAHDLNRAEDHRLSVNLMASILRANLETPVVYTVGNNDVFPDYCSCPDSETLSHLAESLGDILPPSAADTFRRGGYYSMSPTPGLRVISLNTVMWSVKVGRHQPCGCSSSHMDADVGGQMKWVVDELKDSAANGEKVILLGHIPPGVNPHTNTEIWTPAVAARWAKDVVPLLGHVTFTLWGHRHYDLHLVHHGLMGFVLPSISPVNGNNPGFREFTLDAEFRAVDYSQWYADLWTANSRGTITFEEDYTFSANYGRKLSVDALKAIGEGVLKRVEDADEYEAHYMLHANREMHNVACALLHSTEEMYEECVKGVPDN